MLASDQVKDAIGATSVLLVFVTMLFNAKYAEIRKTLGTSMPRTGPNDVRQWRNEIVNCLVSHMLPIVLVSTGATLIFLPVVNTIRLQRTVAYWDNLDFAVTTFVFVFLVIFGLSVWALFRTGTLLLKIRKANVSLK